MKRIYISLSIFIIIGLLCTAGLITTHYITKDFIKLLDETKKAAKNDDYVLAMEKSEEAYEKWEKYEPILCTIVRHNELDTIGLSVDSLSDLIEEDDIATFCSEIEKAKSKLEHIWESELPMFRNLL